MEKTTEERQIQEFIDLSAHERMVEENTKRMATTTPLSRSAEPYQTIAKALWFQLEYEVRHNLKQSKWDTLFGYFHPSYLERKIHQQVLTLFRKQVEMFLEGDEIQKSIEYIVELNSGTYSSGTYSSGTYSRRNKTN